MKILSAILISLVVFICNFANDDQVQVDNELKDHLIILYNNIQDRDHFLQHMFELENNGRIAIIKEGIIKTGYNSIYGAHIPFFPGMTTNQFYNLINEGLNPNLIDRVFSKQLKAGIEYSKIDIKFRNIINLIKFLDVIVRSEIISLKSITFSSGTHQVDNSESHILITFDPKKIIVLSNFITNLDAEIKENIISTKFIVGQFL